MQLVLDAQVKLLLLASLNGNITAEESAVNVRQIREGVRPDDEKNEILFMIMKGIEASHGLRLVTQNEASLRVILKAVADLPLTNPKEIETFLAALISTLHQSSAWVRWIMAPGEEDIQMLVQRLREEEGLS